MTELIKKGGFDVSMLGSGTKHSHIELAETFCSFHKYLRFCVDDKNFYEYRQGRYIQTTDEAIELLMISSDDENKEMKEIKRLTVAGRKNVLANIKVMTHCRLDDFNQVNLINFRNCFYNITTKETLKHSGEILSTIQLPYNYDPNATCELWEKTIVEILQKDEPKIKILQEFMGYCLTRSTKYEKALIMVGDGQNGKSTVLEAIFGMLGEENVSSLSLKNFSNPVQISSILNKFANIVSEIPRNVENFEDELKTITSGEPINVNDKFVKAYSARPFCKLIFSCNRLPTIKDRSKGVYRRLLILEFNRNFRESEQNVDLKDQLKKELPGIFNWALKGLERLIERNRFEIPKEMLEQLREIEINNNPFKLFCHECVEAVPGDINVYISKNELYQEYLRYMKENNMEKTAMYMVTFSVEVKSYFREIFENGESEVRKVIDGRQTRCWLYLRIRNELLDNVEEIQWKN